jgi:hypothetical protein
MRKMILGSVAVAVYFVFAAPNEIKPHSIDAPHSIEVRAAGLKTTTAEKPPACHEVPGYNINSDGRRVHRPEWYMLASRRRCPLGMTRIGGDIDQ